MPLFFWFNPFWTLRPEIRKINCWVLGGNENKKICFWNFLNFKSEMMDEFWIGKNSNILMAKTQKVICVAKLSSSNDNRKPSSSDFQNLISAKCCSNEDHRSISPAAFPNPPTTSGVTVSSFQIHNMLPFDSSFYTLCSNDMRNANSLESVKLS